MQITLKRYTEMLGRIISSAAWARTTSLAQQLLPVLLLLVIVVYFALMSDHFLTVMNGYNIVRQGSILLIVSLGATYVILIGGIDLSVGSIATLTGIIVAFMVNDYGFGPWAFVFGAGVGAFIGLFTGILVAYMKIPSFLVTLGMLSMLVGIGNFMTKGSDERVIDKSFRSVVTGTTVGEIPNLLWWALGVSAITLFIQKFTKFGRYAYVIGGAELVARTAGVPVSRFKVYVFVISGLTAGLAGAILTARVGAGGPGLGEALMLQSITAITIGGTALTGGVGGVHRTMLGVLLVTLLTNGLVLTRVDSFSRQIITGALLIVAVALSLDRKRLPVVK
jgi:ribose transport system permease protein/putative xylitol transport system permease protein